MTRIATSVAAMAVIVAVGHGGVTAAGAQERQQGRPAFEHAWRGE